MKCYICGKAELVRKKIDYIFLGENLGRFEAEVCNAFHEQFFDEKTSIDVEKIAKSKGLWGIEAKTKVAEVGNSYAIRINKKIIDFMSLKKGEEVRLIPESRNRLVMVV